MNVHRVNSALLKGLSIFQMSENQGLIEMYTGTGGSFGAPDMAPTGDPLRGGDGGVNNMNSDAEAFESYIEQTMMSVSARCDVSMDDALEMLVTVADEMAEQGLIPPMPDPDEASAEALSAWAGAAKTAQLGAEVIRACMDAAGDITQGVGGGAA
jgi:hypothetical protein